jgi:Ferric reductase like transmembrane component/Class III cytochrome C family
MRDARYALWGTALVLLLIVPPALAGFAGIGWEASQWAGYAGALACIALAGSPVRPRSSAPPTLVSLRLHTLIGWLALLAVALHIGGLLLADRTVIEYLKPTAPLYQLAGIAATLVLLALALTGGGGARRRLWKSHRGFQATHVILASVLAVLVAAHVIATGRYLGGGARRILFAAAAAGALLMLLRARRPGETTRSESLARRQLVFGRNSTLIAAVLALCAAGITGLIPGRVGAALREPLIGRSAAPPLDFPHSKHGAVNCLTCHHNYADATGSSLCIECHRSSRTDLEEGAEARFHGFCFECHRHPDAAFTHHGPVAGCEACHRPADAEQ